MNAAILFAALVVGGDQPPEAVPLKAAVTEYRNAKPTPAKPSPAAPGAPGAPAVCVDGSCAAPSGAVAESGGGLLGGRQPVRTFLRRIFGGRRGRCASCG